MSRLIAALAAALFIAGPVVVATPLAASAQDVPSYAQPADDGDAQIRGRIVSFDGAYDVQVKDEQGYTDNVRLHQGTIINPTGLTLAPGMVVSILGYNAGSYFSANEIDTPYSYAYGVPYYGGHPWNYYGPSFSLGFFFGNTGWWHGRGFVGPYHYRGGTRVYNNVHMNNVYRGGAFSGHSYVAPRDRGGYYHGGGGHSAGGSRGEGSRGGESHGGGRGGESHGGGHGGESHGGGHGGESHGGGHGGGHEHR